VTQELLQLRILTGLHAQASMPMPEEGQVLFFGRSVDNDVILRDAPFEKAELKQLASGCQLVLGGETFQVTDGLVMQIATLAWVVQPSNTSWPIQWDNALRLDSSKPPSAAESTDSPPSAIDELVAPPEKTTLAIDTTHESPLVHMPEPAPKPWKQFGLWACSLGLVVSLVIWNLWETGPHEAALKNTASDKSTEDNLAEISLADLQKLLKEAGWSDKVRVKPSVQGVFSLQGVVEDMEQVDEVLRLLSIKTRRIQPNVLTQSEFEQRLGSLQQEMPNGMRISAQTGGRILLQAAAAQKDKIAATRQWLLAEVPEASGVDVAGPGETGQRGIFKGDGRWDLPTIISVQSGANGYVMLANGNKVMPGGYLAKLKLSSIEDDTLVLQDHSGQLLRVNR
jgi:hypothetical protein